MSQLISSMAKGLTGKVQVPGDKSISHRALMLSALAIGRSFVRGLLEGEDVMATAAAMRAMGAHVERSTGGSWTIDGVGVGGLRQPDRPLDMGNSGTTTRLLTGLIASHPISVDLNGDASLSKRPMGRVIEPLSVVGARIKARDDRFLPLTIKGSDMPMPIDYTPPVASAQVKSAILLAGLNTPGNTIVRESVATRDHSERMLMAMGADVETIEDGDGGRIIKLRGEPALKPIDMDVPGDISSAAFLLVAATIIPGSDITITGVGMNPLRIGIISALKCMGADITVLNKRDVGGEPAADLRVKAARLKAVSDIGTDPSTMIDEFPVLFVAAAMATGTSRFTGLRELRVKESDRLSAMAAALSANGVELHELDDGMEITGSGGKHLPGGGRVAAQLDHRIAMASTVLGMVTETPVIIDDGSPIGTSFPGYVELMNSIGGALM